MIRVATGFPRKAQAIALALAMACVVHSSAAESLTLLADGDVSAWKPQVFDGIPPTEYKTADDADLGAPALIANSQGGSSGFVLEKPVNVAAYPWLHFQWRVDEYGGGKDADGAQKERTKEGDDFPFRIYFIVGGYLTSRTLALAAGKGGVGDSWRSPYSAFTHELRIRLFTGGGEADGMWRTESVNLHEAWIREFGEIPEEYRAVGIMTDGDNTGVIMRTRYGAIVLSDSSRLPF